MSEELAYKKAFDNLISLGESPGEILEMMQTLRRAGIGLRRIVDKGETHTEETMHKVFQSLVSSGLDGEQAREAISSMENEGILFRERS